MGGKVEKFLATIGGIFGILGSILTFLLGFLTIGITNIGSSIIEAPTPFNTNSLNSFFGYGGLEPIMGIAITILVLSIVIIIGAEAIEDKEFLGSFLLVLGFLGFLVAGLPWIIPGVWILIGGFISLIRGLKESKNVRSDSIKSDTTLKSLETSGETVDLSDKSISSTKRTSERNKVIIILGIVISGLLFFGGFLLLIPFIWFLIAGIKPFIIDLYNSRNDNLWTFIVNNKEIATTGLLVSGIYTFIDMFWIVPFIWLLISCIIYLLRNPSIVENSKIRNQFDNQVSKLKNSKHWIFVEENKKVVAIGLVTISILIAGGITTLVPEPEPTQNNAFIGKWSNQNEERTYELDFKENNNLIINSGDKKYECTYNIKSVDKYKNGTCKYKSHVYVKNVPGYSLGAGYGGDVYIHESTPNFDLNFKMNLSEKPLKLTVLKMGDKKIGGIVFKKQDEWF